MGVVTLAEPMKPSIYGKRSFRHSPSVGRHPAATEWPMSDVTSDLTVEVGSATFALHKFPLVSRSGRIRKLLADAGKEPKIPRTNLSDIPGGSEAFELAAKFCYGVAVDVSLSNVAVLNSVAVFLEMTEDVSEGNLETRTETFLNDVVFPDISNSISVLHRCEPLLPFSDAGTGLVGRLVTSVANNVCKEQLASGLAKLDHHHRALLFPPPPLHNAADEETLSDSWGNSLAVLGVDFFKRVVVSLRGKGLKQEIITKILINYARNSLHRVDDPRSGQIADAEAERKQRKSVEAITSLLPKMTRKGTTTAAAAVPVAFLSSLFKTAMAVSASASCRSDLERRISLQLDEAILEGILVPSSGIDDDIDPNKDSKDGPLFDTDCVSRIFSYFLNLNDDEDEKYEDDVVGDEAGMVYNMDSPGSPKQSTIIKASKLMDSYLAEVALDPNMTHSKFIALAELLPDHARLSSDGLYRAVDIFLKVHPNMSDSEKHRLCKTIDCQKMSQEACSHAAQNDRLPVQMAVQVLYFEQIRLRNAMTGGGGYTHHHQHSHHHHQTFFGQMRSGSAAGSACISPRDNYASVRRENRELKLEVARMRMRLTDLEKDHVSMKEEFVRPNQAASGAANNFLKSFTKRLCKINSLFRGKGGGSSQGRCRFQKRRRHSVS